MLRYLTAGESHGPCLTAVIEGLPSGIPLTAQAINPDLKRRQAGHGRGGRQGIEHDEVQIVSGVRGGRTLGSPITFLIRNRDWSNWSRAMAAEEPAVAAPVTTPRPGHADLAGALKYSTHDVRDILERASARETAARVAVGAVAKRCLAEFGVDVLGHVLAVGPIAVRRVPATFASLARAAESSVTRCADPAASRAQVRIIDRAIRGGDSLGGIVEVRADGVPAGLGSHVQWDRRLDSRLAAAVMSVQSFKGVAIGDAFSVASVPGSRAHDEIFYEKRRGFYRKTNRAGGLEGGITNGEQVVVRGAVKPISTLMRPLRSVDLSRKVRTRALRERSDVCVVPAAAVVAESVVAIELFRAFQEKIGGDSLGEMRRNHRGYLRALKAF